MLDLVLREMGGMSALSIGPWKLLDHVATPSWPRFDVTSTDDAVVITADVPGLGDDDVSIHVAGNVLTIDGKAERPGHASQFRRQFTLADGYDLDRIEAQLDRGVLTVLVPKLERAKPRRIALRGGVIEKVKGLLSRKSGTQE